MALTNDHCDLTSDFSPYDAHEILHTPRWDSIPGPRWPRSHKIVRPLRKLVWIWLSPHGARLCLTSVIACGVVVAKDRVEFRQSLVHQQRKKGGNLSWAWRIVSILIDSSRFMTLAEPFDRLPLQPSTLSTKWYQSGKCFPDLGDFHTSMLCSAGS